MMQYFLCSGSENDLSGSRLLRRGFSRGSRVYLQGGELAGQAPTYILLPDKFADEECPVDPPASNNSRNQSFNGVNLPAGMHDLFLKVIGRNVFGIVNDITGAFGPVFVQ